MSISTNWEVSIRRSGYGHEIALWIYRHCPDNTVQVQHTDENGNWRFDLYKQGEEMQPTLIMSDMFGCETGFFQQFANEIFNTFGIVAEKAPVRSDVIDRMNDHLQDMRRLVLGRNEGREIEEEL